MYTQQYMTVIMVDTTTYKSIYLELVKLVENREQIIKKYTIDTYKGCVRGY